MVHANCTFVVYDGFVDGGRGNSVEWQAIFLADGAYGNHILYDTEWDAMSRVALT